MFGGVVGKAVGLVASGMAGAVAWDGVKQFARSDAMRGAAVTVTSWGLRGARAAETGAETVRLTTADIVSEARERIGEQNPPPATATADAHEHEH
jgi:hypothetical protein